MKQYIFQSKNGGWYIYGSNYKDKSDVAYLNLFFPQDTAPKSFDKKMLIDIQEAKFTSYKKQLGLTIFKYEQLDNIELVKEDTSMFGGERSKLGGEINIEQQDLPFY